MKYFTFKDFERTDQKIDNSIVNDNVRRNIQEFVEDLLDPLREAWTNHCERNELGSGAIRMSSGYRSPKLNRAVGGSATSAHSHGWGGDISPMNGHMDYFQNFVKNWLGDKNYDQLIFENVNSKGISSWIHIGYRYPKTHGFRKQNLIKYPSDKNYYPLV